MVKDWVFVGVWSLMMIFCCYQLYRIWSIGNFYQGNNISIPAKSFFLGFFIAFCNIYLSLTKKKKT